MLSSVLPEALIEARSSVNMPAPPLLKFFFGASSDPAHPTSMPAGLTNPAAGVQPETAFYISIDPPRSADKRHCVDRLNFSFSMNCGWGNVRSSQSGVLFSSCMKQKQD